MMKFRIQICFTLLTTTLLLGACCLPPTSQPQNPSSPISPISPLYAAVPFQLDKPIPAGTTRVKGAGVPGVPITIVSISNMGQNLGMGTVDSDGTFEVEVPALEANLFVGLMVGDTATSQWQPEKYYGKEFHGEGAMQIPQVGFFHDTTTVTEK
jgi:hypothetical protein